MPKPAIDLLVRGDVVLPMTDGLPELPDSAVAIRDGRIVAVGAAVDLAERFDAADEISGGIVLPGLVNCHGHAGMTLYRGLGDDMPLERWLHEFVWPAEMKFATEENVALGTQLAIAEMFASGTTTFTDMYFFQQRVGEVCADAGMRVMLGQAVIGFPVPGCPDIQTSFRKADALAANFAGHPIVNVSMALHAVYTLSREQLTEGAQHADRLGVPLQIHMSESVTEVENCKKEHGLTPPALLAATGVLRKGTICAHGVHVTDDDIALIEEAGAGIALNPESNLKLASGIPDIPRLLAADIPLGLGTDGAASNNDLDLWDSLRLAALLPKGTSMDPELVPAADAVRLATRGGAEVLGLSGRVGTLEPGKSADLCVVATGDPHLVPLYHPYSHLTYAVKGSDVVHTVVEGRVVYRDGRHTTLDVPEIVARVRALALQIAGG